MRKIIFLSLLVFFACPASLFASDTLFSFSGPIKKDPSAPLLIIFYKPDCTYCQKMSSDLEKDKSFSALLNSQFNVQHINISEGSGRALASKFNVRAVPTIIQFNPSSNLYETIKGYPGIPRIAAALRMNYTHDAMPSNPNQSFAACGDGIIDGGESCDDANTNSGDGCSAACQVEMGFSCTGEPSVCSTLCGDGVIAGAEACDDGNTNGGDGCSSSCNIEPGYICTGSPSVCMILLPDNNECGGATALAGTRGNIQDDNTNATNSQTGNPACQPLWQKDLWYSFNLNGNSPVSIAVNGLSMTDPILALYSGNCNALVPAGCDDNSGTGMNALFTGNLPAGNYFIRVMGAGASPSGIGSFSLVYNLNGICGNNIVEFGEECDDGNLNNGDGCSSTCNFENAVSQKGISINEDGVRSNPSAMLDVKSDNKGILIPRLTSAQRTAILNPAAGLIVYDLTTSSFWYQRSGTWTEIGSSTASGFSVFNNNSQAFSAQFDLSLPSEQYDDGNNFESNTYTTPGLAVYNLSGQVSFSFTSVTAQTVISLAIVNSSSGNMYSSNSIIVPAGFSGVMHLNTGSSVKIDASTPVKLRVLVNGNPGTQQVTAATFSGFKVY